MGLFRNLLHLTSSGKQDYYYNFSVGDYVPIGSTRLEYLQSSGTQYVDTDIVPGDDNVKVEIKYQYLENKSTGYDSVMGSHEISGGTTRFYVSSLSSTTTDRMVMGNGVINIPHDHNVHTIIFNDENHDCYLDGTWVGNVGTTFTGNKHSIHMFGVNHGGTSNYKSASRIYYCKIWKNGELISDMIPCLNADNTSCFYDLKRRKRFFNMGTGTFKYMYPSLHHELPEGYRSLDYVVATGAQYINTNSALWSNSDWILETKFSLPKFKNDNQLLGLHSAIDTNYQTKVQGTGAYFYKFNASSNTLATLVKDDIYTVVHDNTSGVLINRVNNSYNQTTRAVTTNTSPIHLGHRLGSTYLEGKIYGLRMWSNSRQIREFIPCLNPEGEAGLYDCIESVFYPSIGDLPFYSEEGIEDFELPDEYVQVDYIQSSGTQYINTGFYPTGDTRYDIKFSKCKTSGVLFGAYNNTWTDGYGLYTNVATNGKYYMHYYSNTSTNITSTAGASIVMDRGVCNINNTSFLVNSNILTSEVMYPLYLFCGNKDGSVEQPVIMNLEYFKIYSHGLVRDFIPVVRKADNVAGLYDKVTNEFYGNAGTGEFIPAEISTNTVLPSGYEQLESIISTGTQYIDTGYIPGNTTKIIMDFNFYGTDSTDVMALYGARANTTTGVFATWLSNTQAFPHYGNTTYNVATVTMNTLDRITYIMDGNKIEYGGYSGTLSSYTFSSGYSLTLLALNQAGVVDARRASGQLFSAKIYDNDVLVRNFIPARRLEDEAIGLYCVVTNTFYPNQGTSNFAYTSLGDGITLPAEYLRLKGLTASGRQCINTGLVPTGTMEFDIKFNIKNSFSSSSFGTVFGSRDSYYQRGYHLTTFTMYTNAGHFLYGTNSNADNIRYEANMVKDGSDQTISFHDNVLTGGNGGTVNIPAQEFTNSRPIYLFALNNGGAIEEYSTSTIYSCKFYDNNELVRHFVPAQRRADGVLGMYDMVTDSFYTNVGSGTFTAIEYPDASPLPASYTPVNYIESTGTQYINTGVAPSTMDTMVEVQYMFLGNKGTGFDSIIGSRGHSSGTGRYYPVSCNGTSGVRHVMGDNVLMSSYDLNQIHTVIFNNSSGQCLVDGTVVGDVGTRFKVHSYPMFLFGLNMDGKFQYMSLSRIYYCKIWQNGTLLRYMIPCLNPNGKPGFYDLVNNVFYGNVGTGTFFIG